MQEMSILELQEKMNSGDLSARAIAEMYLKRIAEVDQSGSAVNSVAEINTDALAIADALDEERRTSGPRGPLHGIPIILKDNIDTADGMQTTAGSLALSGSLAAQDSTVAQKLRQAGAVILAKANLSEWANFRSTRSTSGWSSRGGQVHNPYALDRNPCGSSSGSAVAAAANLCAAAIGTETDGSVVCPSSVNSVVGIKPTLGLVSRAGIIPIAHSQDTAGPMGRTVTDAAIVLGALTGIDPRDPDTAGSQGKAYADYTQFLDPDGLQGARIGIARNYFGKNPRVDQLMEGCIDEMKRCGAQVIDPVNLDNAAKLWEPELQVLLYEFKADLNAYLAGMGPDAPVRSLAEVIEFNEQNRDRTMPYFDQEILVMAEEKGPLTDEAYIKARATCLRLARDEGIDAALNEHGLDAIVAATTGTPWPIDPVNGDNIVGGCSGMAAVAGYAHVTVPAGYVFGLPVGISFFGGPYQEPTLIKLAYAFEQATQRRRPPQYLPTADLSLD